MKTMLITGATGFLGSRIAQYYRKNYTIFTPSHSEMDIADENSVLQYFKEKKPDIVVHCAAVSDVGMCEKEPKYARKINVVGTENIVKAAKELSEVCICCSSDQVYCGMAGKEPNMEDSFINPTNVYGKLKAHAEQSCLSIDKDSVHLRLSWMYDATDTKRMDFIKQLQACAMHEKECFFSPKDKRGITDVWEVVKNIEQAFKLPGGIYHFGSPNDKSTYETVLAIFEKKGYNTSFVRKMENVNPRNLMMSQEKINQYGIYFSDTVEGVLKAWKRDLNAGQANSSVPIQEVCKKDEAVQNSNVCLKTIQVVAAIIKATNEAGNPIIFATQRGYGAFKDGWEFPGGKIEEGETPQEALVREIREELETEIVVGALFDTVEYDYPTFHLSMDCFQAEIISGELVLKEHTAAKWLTKEELHSVEWLPADIALVEKIQNNM